MTLFHHTERHLSQVPALELLANCSYQILRHVQALQERQGKHSNVLLESVLREQLQQLNRIRYKDKEYYYFFHLKNIRKIMKNTKDP